MTPTAAVTRTDAERRTTMNLERTGTLSHPANRHLHPTRHMTPIGARLISLGWVLLTAITIGTALALTATLTREAPVVSTEVVTATPTLLVSTQEPFTVICEDPHPSCIPPR
jgi:hypothetical protein